jgi:hypothetical protein
MKCELFMALRILPTGARVDLSKSPELCLEFARRVKRQLEADGQPPTRVELNVTHRGHFYCWQWP